MDSFGAQKGRDFLAMLKEKDVETTDPSFARWGVVSSVSGDLVAVKMNTAGATAAQQLLARVAGPPVIAGDPGILIPMLGGGYVFAKIGGDTSFAGLRIESETVPQFTPQPTKGLDFSQAFALTIEDAAGVDAHTDEINVDLNMNSISLLAGTSALAARSNHTHEGNNGGYFMQMGSDSGGTTGTNASTSTYVELFQEAVSLPLGTWTVRVLAFGQFSNSTATGGATMRVKSPVLSGGIGIAGGVISARFMIIKDASNAGMSGSINVGAEYTSRTGGTATAISWAYLLEAFRTGN